GSRRTAESARGQLRIDDRDGAAEHTVCQRDEIIVGCDYFTSDEKVWSLEEGVRRCRCVEREVDDVETVADSVWLRTDDVQVAIDVDANGRVKCQIGDSWRLGAEAVLGHRGPSVASVLRHHDDESIVGTNVADDPVVAVLV